jgi:1-deoxy-D-xylulose-5-phosphate synthase
MLVDMLHTALCYDDGPVALRYPRGAGIGTPLPSRPSTIEIGSGEILHAGDNPRVALLGYGSGVGKALEASQLLAERGIATTVADARFAKPIDLVTVEEGVLAGGFGSAVWETLSDAGVSGPSGSGALAGGPRILRVGLPDAYVTHGAPALLHEEVGFTGKRIAERVEAAVATATEVA